MWCVPSRGRPHNAERLVRAFRRTGARTWVFWLLDDDDPTLGGYPPPPSDIAPRTGLAARYNRFFEMFPDLPWYGFLADDVVPETPGWDERLIEMAGKDGMAVPDGGHDPLGTPHFVLAGDLVREIGWLALPGLDRLYIDTAWADIARERGVLRRVPVMVRHLHFSNGRAPMDATYRKRRKAEDKEIYERWKLQDEVSPAP